MAGRSPYAKGHSAGFCVNDSVDKPLTILLTPEYVREDNGRPRLRSGPTR